jgi:group I intron endonuclease
MTYTEILNSDLSKSKNVIYKFTNLVNNKVYIG